MFPGDRVPGGQRGTRVFLHKGLEGPHVATRYHAWDLRAQEEITFPKPEAGFPHGSGKIICLHRTPEASPAAWGDLWEGPGARQAPPSPLLSGGEPQALVCSLIYPFKVSQECDE